MSFERFRAATLWAMLAFAGVNAGSFFARSNVERLWGVRRSGSVEAIGFPLLVWSEDDRRAEYFSYPAFATDLSIGVATALVVGLAWSRLASGAGGKPENGDSARQAACPASAAAVDRRFQFGVRSMLAAMLLVACCLGALRADRAVAPWIVILGYASGPWIILAAAHAARRAGPTLRVLSASAVALAIVAAVVRCGGSLDSPRAFDRIFMGLFVCWVPQCVLAAAVAALAARFATAES